MSNLDGVFDHRRVAVIGGSGFGGGLADALPGVSHSETVATEYGVVTVTVRDLDTGGSLVFLPRHGAGHSIPPHEINHHANIAALNALDIAHIISTAAVGSLRRDLDSGTVIVLDDFIDFRGGVTTFYGSESGKVRHTDFSEPLCHDLRLMLLEEANSLSCTWMDAPLIYPAGTYLCVNGPRYETPAEVRMFGLLGADVVGMTIAAEAILARELDICYACVGLVTNLGTGLSTAALSHSEVEAQMLTSRPFITDVIVRTVTRLLSAEQG